MRYNDLAFIITAIVIFLCVGATAINIEMTHKHDQPMEQITEVLIKKATGLDIDLTPMDDNYPKDVNIINIEHNTAENSKVIHIHNNQIPHENTVDAKSHSKKK